MGLLCTGVKYWGVCVLLFGKPCALTNIALSFLFMKVPLNIELHNLWTCAFHHNCDYIIA